MPRSPPTAGTPTGAEAVPAERLVEWQPGDGWGPLCAALGVAEPAEPFPHTNTTDDFRSSMDLTERAVAARYRWGRMSPVIDIDDLRRGENSHQFIGADHDVPVSMFLVHSAPGKGPSLHRHPVSGAVHRRGRRGDLPRSATT